MERWPSLIDSKAGQQVPNYEILSSWLKLFYKQAPISWHQLLHPKYQQVSWSTISLLWEQEMLFPLHINPLHRTTGPINFVFTGDFIGFIEGIYINVFWCVETGGGGGGFFFAKKNIFVGCKWTRNLGFRHFQRFLPIKFLLTIPSKSIVIWNLHAKSFPMVPRC